MAVPLSYNVRNLLVRRWTSAFTAGGIALVVAATMLLAAPGRRAPADAGRRPASPTTWSCCARAPPTTARARCRARRRRPCASLPGIARGADGRAARLARDREPAVHAHAPTAGARTCSCAASSRSRSPCTAACGSSRAACSARSSARSWSASAPPAATRRGLGGEIELRAAALDRGRHLRRRRHGVRQRDLGRRDRRPGRHAPRGLLRHPLTRGAGQPTRSAHRGASRPTRASRSRPSPRPTYYAEQAETAQLALRPGPHARHHHGRRARRSARSTPCTPRSRTARAEIGTLRALGFSRGAILLSFLAESLLLAAGAGSSRASRSARLAMLAVNTLLSGGRLQHDDLHRGDRPPRALARRRRCWASCFAAAIGVLGGLAPAWRAAHLRVVDALRHA